MAALAAPPPAPATPLAGVRVAQCVPAGNSATFYAHMLRLPHTRAMSIRLTLLQRTGGTGFAPLKLPSLSRWRTSQPGRRGLPPPQAAEPLALAHLPARAAGVRRPPAGPQPPRRRRLPRAGGLPL